MGKELLTLETLAPDRPTVRIDGETYQLKRVEDFGVSEWGELQRLQRQGEEIGAIPDGQETDEQIADLSKFLRQMVRMVVVDAPDKVLKRLNDNQRMALLSAFTEATKAATSQAQNRAARRQIGASKRRASKGSTKRRIH